MDALGLVAVLIELIAQHGDGNRKRADDKIKHVVASHGIPLRRDWGMLAAASIRVAVRKSSLAKRERGTTRIVVKGAFLISV